MKTSRCPVSWTFDLSVIALARELGVDWPDAEARLRDYEFRTPRSDWDAVARNWIREDAARNGTGRAVANGGRQLFAAERTMENIRRFMADDDEPEEEPR